MIVADLEEALVRPDQDRKGRAPTPQWRKARQLAPISAVHGSEQPVHSCRVLKEVAQRGSQQGESLNWEGGVRVAPRRWWQETHGRAH